MIGNSCSSRQWAYDLRMSSITLAEVSAGADLETVRTLFQEYEAQIGVSLCFQGFAAELAALPGDYTPPRGTLVLARVDGRVAGCVAAHAWDGEACEMKRLFVRREFRGSGCGLRLVRHVLDWARAAGFRSVRLDTLPSMEKAQALYRSLGFREIAPYRPNPVAGVRYFELTLDATA